jgi:hypothetical protein
MTNLTALITGVTGRHGTLLTDQGEAQFAELIARRSTG